MENFLIEQMKKIDLEIEKKGYCNILVADTETTGLPKENGPKIEVTSFGGVILKLTRNPETGDYSYEMKKKIDETFHVDAKIESGAVCITNLIKEEDNKKLSKKEKVKMFIDFYITNKLRIKNGTKSSITSKEIPALQNLIFNKYLSKRFFSEDKTTTLTKEEMIFAKKEEQDKLSKEEKVEIIKDYYFKDLPKKVGEKKDYLFQILEKLIETNELREIPSSKKKFSKEYYENLIKDNEVSFVSYHNAGYDIDSVLTPTYDIKVDDSTVIDTMHFKFFMDALKTSNPGKVQGLKIPESGRVVKGQSVDNWVKKVKKNKGEIKIPELKEMIDNLEEYREFHSATADALLSAYILTYQFSEVNKNLKPLLLEEDKKEIEEKISFENGIPLIRTSSSLDNTIEYNKLIEFLTEKGLKEIIIVDKTTRDFPNMQGAMEKAGIKMITGVNVSIKETGEKYNVLFKNTEMYRKLLPLIQGNELTLKELEKIKKYFYKGEDFNLFVRKEVTTPEYLKSDLHSKVGSFSYQKQVSNSMTTNFETRKKINSKEDSSFEKGLFTTKKEQEEYKNIMASSSAIDYFWFPKLNLSAFPDFNVLEALIDNKDNVEKAFEELEEKSKKIASSGKIIQLEEEDFDVAFDRFKERLYKTMEKNNIRDLNYIQYKNMKKCGVEVDEKLGLKGDESEEEIREAIEKLSNELIEIELKTLKEMGNIDYIKFYVLMLAIVSFTNPGPGRGSAAGSYMNMIFEITNPGMFYFLDFYRFLNPDRREMPDVDVDFSANGPAAKMIGHLLSKANYYYHKHTMKDHPLLSVYDEETRMDIINDYYLDPEKLETARISTETKASGKTVLESALRLRGAPKFMLDAISAKNAWNEELTIYENINSLGDITYEIYRYLPEELLESLEELKGLPVGTGQHAAGVLFPNMPISMLALVNEDGAVEFTKKTIEDMLLIKMDFLGLSSLTDIQQTENLVEEHEELIKEAGLEKGFVKKMLKEHDFSDPKVYSSIANGYTSQTFQMFSPAAKRMAKGLAPLNLSLLSAISALNRPGPLQTGADKDFIATSNEERRKKYKVDYISKKDWKKLSGNDKLQKIESLRNKMKEDFDVVQLEDWVLEKIITYAAVELEEEEELLKTSLNKIEEYKKITKDTYGVIIYQEQITSVAQEMAGFAPGEAQELRSAVSKKKNMDRFSEKFKEGLVKNKGVDPKVAELFWKNIEAFGEYAFNKAHTDSYGQITFLSQYLKENLPLESYSVLINNVADIKKQGLIQEILTRSKDLFDEEDPFKFQTINKIDSITIPSRKKGKGYLGIPYTNLTGVGLKDLAPLIRFNKDGAESLSEYMLMNGSTVSNSSIRAIVSALGAQKDLPADFMPFSVADFEYNNKEVATINEKALKKYQKIYAQIIKDSFTPKSKTEEKTVALFSNKKIMNSLDLLREYSKLYSRQGIENVSDFIAEKEKARSDFEKSTLIALEGKDSTFSIEIKPYVRLTIIEKYKAPVKGPNQIEILKENIETGEKSKSIGKGFFEKDELGQILKVEIQEDTGINPAQIKFINQTINAMLSENEIFSDEKKEAEEYIKDLLKEIDNDEFDFFENQEVLKKGKAIYLEKIKKSAKSLDKEIEEIKVSKNFETKELTEDMINEIRAKYLKNAASMFKIQINLDEMNKVATNELDLIQYTSNDELESNIFILGSTLSGDKNGLGEQTKDYVDTLSEMTGRTVTFVPYHNMNENQFKAFKELLTEESALAYTELNDLTMVELRNEVERVFKEVNSANGQKVYVKQEELDFIIDQIFSNVSDYETNEVKYQINTKSKKIKEMSIKMTVDSQSQIAKIKFSSLEDTIDFKYSNLIRNENDNSIERIELTELISNVSEAYANEAKKKVETFINGRGLSFKSKLRKEDMTGLEIWNEYKIYAERTLHKLIEDKVGAIILPSPSFSSKMDMQSSIKKVFGLNRNEELSPGTSVTSIKTNPNTYILSTAANSMYKNYRTGDFTPGSLASLDRLTEVIKKNVEEEDKILEESQEEINKRKIN